MDRTSERLPVSHGVALTEIMAPACVSPAPIAPACWPAGANDGMQLAIPRRRGRARSSASSVLTERHQACTSSTWIEPSRAMSARIRLGRLAGSRRYCDRRCVRLRQ